MKDLITYIFNWINELNPLKKKDMIEHINQHLVLIKNTMPKKEETKQEALLRVAKENLGRDVTPEDKVTDEYACMTSLSTIIKKIDPSFPFISYTLYGYAEFKKNPNFKATLELEPGNILISPTTMGNGKIIGHCGVLLENNKIASNNSLNGQWEDYYTIDKWIKRYRRRGDLPLFVFKMV